MATCSNCNARLSCGCQKRTASDGKGCCSTCINAYEARIKGEPKPSQITPTKLNSQVIAPQRKVWGRDRYVKK